MPVKASSHIYTCQEPVRWCNTCWGREEFQVDAQPHFVVRPASVGRPLLALTTRYLLLTPYTSFVRPASVGRLLLHGMFQALSHTSTAAVHQAPGPRVTGHRAKDWRIWSKDSPSYYLLLATYYLLLTTYYLLLTTFRLLLTTVYFLLTTYNILLTTYPGRGPHQRQGGWGERIPPTLPRS